MKRGEPDILAQGKRFHLVVQRDWIESAQGNVSSEKSVRKPNGRRGRIDVHADSEDSDMVAVLEVKSTDWDAIKGPAIRRNVRRHARQIWAYVESQLADGKSVSPGIAFPRRPASDTTLSRVEQLFEEEGVAVVWYDESIEERKARALRDESG